MLIEFRVENYRSIRDEQVLTMEAGRSGLGRIRGPGCPGCQKKILPVAALYGANASGKSNVLSALAFMKDAVILSLRHWSPDEGIPQDPFAWGKKREEPTGFEIEIVLDGTRYRYGFRFNDRVFLDEWLYAWPNGKKQTWLVREGDSFSFGDNLKGENKVIEEVTRPNALFLSAAAQLRHPQLSPIYSWFSTIETISLRPRRAVGSVFVGPHASEYAIATMLEESSQPTLFADEEAPDPLVQRFKSLLRNADVGIVDVRAVRKEQGARRPWRFELKHRSEEDNAWLPLEEESRGTQTLFRLALPVLRAIERGKLLVVDELESSMHPNLAEHIVRQFNDPEINPHGAQLIFSTHDTNLLGTLSGEPVLRRDQVWLTEKDENGATVLYPLSDFKPRKDENVERGYVQGRFGAIPYLGNFHPRGGVSRHELRPRSSPEAGSTPRLPHAKEEDPHRLRGCEHRAPVLQAIRERPSQHDRGGRHRSRIGRTADRRPRGEAAEEPGRQGIEARGRSLPEVRFGLVRVRLRRASERARGARDGESERDQGRHVESMLRALAAAPPAGRARHAPSPSRPGDAEDTRPRL